VSEPWGAGVGASCKSSRGVGRARVSGLEGKVAENADGGGLRFVGVDGERGNG